MGISDLFSFSFLFSVAIILLLFGILYIYFGYKIVEQDHKLNSMVNLVSTLAYQMEHIRKEPTVNNPINLEYSSQLIGGNDNTELISVSDDEECYDNDNEDEDEDDDNEDEDEDNEDEDEDNEDEDEDNEYEDNEDDNNKDDDNEDENNEDINNNTNNQIKLLNLSLIGNLSEYSDNACQIEDFSEIDKIDTFDVDAAEINEITETNISNEIIGNIEPVELTNNNEFLKNINITDLGENDDLTSSKSEYKKMSLNKLREVVVSKGVIPDASKLKKNEILKILGDD
jgi:hypothetical protein